MALNEEPLVVLVDREDREIGLAPKTEAHQKALLHRAFSVFVFNGVGELLLQQRSPDKYHSGGLWTNTCCSHPLPGEDIHDAAHRRLVEEMGMDCPLESPFGLFTRPNLKTVLASTSWIMFFGKQRWALPH